MIKKIDRTTVLYYSGLPIIMIALWIFKHEQLLNITMLLRLVLTAFGYVAMVGDIREKRVPNALVVTLLAAWALIMVPQLFYQTQIAIALMVSGGIGFLLAGIIFLVVYLISRGGLGGGDVKLMAVAGLYLGFNGVLPAMLYGSILAALVTLTLVFLKKLGRKDTFPLVPFLYVGMLLTMFTQ